ncbi:hypothetical protein ABFB09_07915 [Dehalogenimonas sp. THU2]|uniref:hypothetical protein n=1 Tax=Dehalogenimonas sp. THU2 TaxID=3151121 RepID=UPI00321891B7
MKHTAQQILMALGTLFILVMLPHDLLYSSKSICIHQRFVVAFDRDIAGFQPCLTEVETMMEYLAPSLFADAITIQASVSQGIGVIGPSFECPLAGGELIKCMGNERAIVGVDLNPSRGGVMLVEIAEGCLLGPTAGLDSSLHTLCDFDCQVLGVPRADDLHHAPGDVTGRR